MTILLKHYNTYCILQEFMAIIKMGGEDIVISKFRSSLEGKPISANTQQGCEEMIHITELVS